MKCIGTEEDWRDAWGRFRPLTREELEQTKVCFDRPIFYDAMGQRNRRVYWCPGCGQYEEWRGWDIYERGNMDAHHGDAVSCSQCGYSGELVCLGRCRSFASVNRSAQIVWAHESGGWLLLEAGFGKMEYSAEDLDPYPSIQWVARYAIRAGKRLKWADGQYSGKSFQPNRYREQKGEEYFRRKTYSEPFTDGPYYSPRSGKYAALGLTEAVRASELRYCEAERLFEKMGLYTEEGIPAGKRIVSYLGWYAKYPMLEMLIKAGHEEAVIFLLENGMSAEWDWRARTPWAFFRLEKQQYKRFREAGMSATELSSYRAWTDGTIEQYIELKRLMGARLGTMCGYAGKNHKRQKRVAMYLQTHDWQLWRDTMDMERKLGNELHDRVLMPEDLTARHDECVRLEGERLAREQRLKDMAAAERLNELREEYKKTRYRELRGLYEFELGELCIRVPRDDGEIVREGSALHHCVGGYAERHLKGVKTVLFLRWLDDPETPYVTIELEPRSLYLPQVYGYHDDNLRDKQNKMITAKPREIHEGFLAAWVEWMRQGSRRTSTGRPIVKKEEIA